MFNAIKNWFANRNKLPEVQMAELWSEGLLMIDEGIKGKLTYRNFRAPGKYSGLRSVWFRSSVVLTDKRIFATAYGKNAIDVPFSDERIRQMQFSIEDGPRLVVILDASLFQPTWSGTLEYRFTLENAQKYLDIIHQKLGEQH